MKVVFDTNVLFAALVSRQGVCAEILNHTLRRHTLVLSNYILDELRQHLSGKRKLTPVQVNAAIDALVKVGRIAAPVPVPAEACRDPNDLPVIGTALAGDAAVLVTGDQDLLVLRHFQNVEILSPHEFRDRHLAAPGRG